jgi:hypothetical protein
MFKVGHRPSIYTVLYILYSRIATPVICLSGVNNFYGRIAFSTYESCYSKRVRNVPTIAVIPTVRIGRIWSWRSWRSSWLIQMGSIQRLLLPSLSRRTRSAECKLRRFWRVYPHLYRIIHGVELDHRPGQHLTLYRSYMWPGLNDSSPPTRTAQLHNPRLPLLQRSDCRDSSPEPGWRAARRVLFDFNYLYSKSPISFILRKLLEILAETQFLDQLPALPSCMPHPWFGRLIYGYKRGLLPSKGRRFWGEIWSACTIKDIVFSDGVTPVWCDSRG